MPPTHEPPDDLTTIMQRLPGASETLLSSLIDDPVLKEAVDEDVCNASVSIWVRLSTHVLKTMGFKLTDAQINDVDAAIKLGNASKLNILSLVPLAESSDST